MYINNILISNVVINSNKIRMAKSTKTTKNGSVDTKNEEDDKSISMHMVKELMRVQQEAMLACFNNTVKNLSEKVDMIMCDVQELKTSLNFMGSEQRETLDKVNADIRCVKTDLNGTNLFNNHDRNLLKQHSEKLIDMEDRSRRNNLRIDGLVENEKETWEETEIKVKNLFRDKLEITEEVEIDRALCKSTDHRPLTTDHRPPTNLHRPPTTDQ